MSKSKIVFVFLVCMFTNLSVLNAEVGFADMGPEKDMVSNQFPDGGEDLGTDTPDMGVKRSTPLDPDYQPKVSSEAECFCGSIQSESGTHWGLLLLLGLVFGWTKKGRR